MKSKGQNTEKEIEFFNLLEMADYTPFPPDQKTFNFIYQELEKFNLEGLGLEAGCGLAALGKKLLERNKKINLVGVDINPRIVDQVRKNKLEKYKIFRGNLENKDLFEKEKFDFIIFPYVLHHLPDTELIMENAYGWLKKGGLVIIFDPNASNLILQLSYNLRKLFRQFVPSFISKCASDNEKNVPREKLFDHLNGKFELLLYKTYLIGAKSNNSLPFLIKILGSIRYLFLIFYYRLPFFKDSGSDIIVVLKRK